MKNILKHRSFIGKHAEDLGQLIGVQIKPIYESLGILVPVKSCSIVHYLYQNRLSGGEGLTLSDLSKTLNQSHQLVKQKLPRLLKLDLINVRQDSEDKRRYLYSLTELGVTQAVILAENPLEKVYQHLFDEINTDLNQVLIAAINGLKKQNLMERFAAQSRPKLNPKTKRES